MMINIIRGVKVSKRGVGYLYIFFSWAYSYLRSLKRATLLYRYDARRWTSAPVGYMAGTYAVRPPGEGVRSLPDTYPLINLTTKVITQILSIHWSLIEVIHTVVEVEVKEQLVHVTTTTVLAKVQIPTTGFAVMLQVTHCSGHVLDPI